MRRGGFTPACTWPELGFEVLVSKSGPWGEPGWPFTGDRPEPESLSQPKQCLFDSVCCFIPVQSSSQVVKKYVNSQRNYWDMRDRCLKACTYFSLHSQFAGTTVTKAFLLLALLLPSAYGWAKWREIEDLKKKSKRRQHHQQSRKNLPLLFNLVWKRRMWSQCEKGVIAYQGCVLRKKWAGWYLVLRVLPFLHLARTKQEHKEEKWVYKVKWSQPRGLLGSFLHFGCHGRCKDV